MEVSYDSFCSRQAKSFCAMCLGIILVPCTMAFIFWNENDAVVNYETAKVVWSANFVDNCMPRADNAGKLVLAPCNVYAPDLAPGLPSTLRPFLTAFNGSQVQWSTELYLYKETEKENCHKDNKGGQVCTKYYTCELTWSDSWIDSSGFRCPNHPSNRQRTFPQGFQASGDNSAAEYSVVLSHDGQNRNGLSLDMNLQQQLPSADLANRLLRYPQGWTQVYQRLGGSLSPNMLQVNGGYLTTYRSQPQPGDLRISLQGRSATTATAAAKQSTSADARSTNYRLGAWPPQSFGWFGKHTKPLEKLLPGRLSASEFVKAWESQISAQTWLLRFVSLVVMVIAFELIIQPLSVAADLLRMINCCTCGLGSLLDGAAQCVIHTLAFAAACCLFLITVAIAWIVARPLLGIFLVLMAIALFYVVYRAQHKRGARAPQVFDASAGLMAGGAMAGSPASAAGLRTAGVPMASAVPMAAAVPMAPAMPVAMAVPPQQSMQVMCPNGVQPGDMLNVQGPDGHRFMAQVPAGVRPGQAFNVQMPP